MNAIIFYGIAICFLLLGLLCHHRGYTVGYRDGENAAQAEATRRIKRDQLFPLFWRH